MAAIPSTSTAVDVRALTDAQQALLARLHAYSPDDPNAPLPYSRRLAEAEGWSHAHALAVIDEYKRFAFLAQAAGHPVTPPVAVDAAWHFHLQYTLEYWDVFCAGVLRARLHHMPGTGAPDEAAVYAQRYRDTLDSYRRLFGSEPPESIWPSPVGLRDASGLPQPEPSAVSADGNAESPAVPPAGRTWRDRLPKLAWPAAAASVAATCASAQDFNVLNYTGPQFLAFYVPVCVVALLLIVALQGIEFRRRRWGGRTRKASADLSADEVAYLTGGEARVAQVVTMSLAHAGAVDLRTVPGQGGYVQIADADRAGRHDDHCAWLKERPSGTVRYDVFRERLAGYAQEVVDGMRAQGWLWAPGEMRASRLAARAIVLLVLGTGAAKLAVGLSRGRPVLLLAVSMAVFAVAYRIIARRLTGFGRGGATAAGRAALLARRIAHDPRAARNPPPDAQAMQQTQDRERGDPDPLLWTAALFGAGALAGTAWSVYSQTVQTASRLSSLAAAKAGSGSSFDASDSRCSSPSDSSSSSCSSSSCSSSSCGGCSSSN
ncbi:TIGR04222 domain-containing membrane protein [Burkholderia sp. Ac-20344]|uniref:TIGR04222 domain-containing membrane protein n=1 Tax=Burkholderia sp. Ac-20344 TaxID=2703890 RepID=UPI00197C9531|nr:TIGR04222 domain-containing membrane protein [Burkholderia sp. Ac-20344]MBN3836466.1 TIGR04222 domain-containing membrane protein [Burkholderia sp. Ac-20344]